MGNRQKNRRIRLTLQSNLNDDREMKPKDHKNKKSLSYQMATFKFAWQGLRYYFETELKASIHLIAALLATGLGIFLKISAAEWMMVVFAIGIVIIAEIVNTAIELLVDLITPEQNKNAGITKDLAASAVLVASTTALAIGFIVFLPKLLVLFRNF
jgi:diacylglycerol kinase